MSTIIIVPVNTTPPPPTSYSYAFESTDGVLITATVNTGDAARAETLANQIASANLSRVAYPSGRTSVLSKIGYVLGAAFLGGIIAWIVTLFGWTLWPSLCEAVGFVSESSGYYRDYDDGMIWAIRAALVVSLISAIVVAIAAFGMEE